MARRRSPRLAARAATLQPNAPSQSPMESSPPPPSVPAAVFPLLSLPAELTLHVASYLPPRTVVAMLLTSSALAHLSTILTILSRQDITVTHQNRVHVYTPLQFFCKRGIESVVHRLLQEGADPNAVPVINAWGGFQPLVFAMIFGGAKIVALLIKYGAHVNRQDRQFSPLEFAIGGRWIFARSRSMREGFFSRAAELPRIVQLLVDAGPDVNDGRRIWGTPLYMACGTRKVDPLIVAVLIAAGADVHARRSGHSLQQPAGGTQPIHNAASAGAAEIMQLLLDAGADVESRNQTGYRPLDIAIGSQNMDVFKVLIAAGASTHTDSALCNPIRTTIRELDRLLTHARELSGVPNPWQLFKPEAQMVELMRWLDLRGCRPTTGDVDLSRFAASHLSTTRSGRR